MSEERNLLKPNDADVNPPIDQGADSSGTDTDTDTDNETDTHQDDIEEDPREDTTTTQTALHRPSDSVDHETYYSIDSDAASSTYYSVHRPPTVGSSLLDSGSLRPSSHAPSRQPHMQGTISSVKILSPEEIFRANSFQYSTDENRTPTSDNAPARNNFINFNSPWGSEKNSELQGPSTQSGSQKPEEQPVFSNARLATSDAKMIMNINASTSSVPSSGKRVSIANSVNSANAIYDKNNKLIQKLEQGSQSTLNSSQGRRQTVTMEPAVREEDAEPGVFDDRRQSTASRARRGTVTHAMNQYANLENTPGFVGVVALGFASMPSPKSLLNKGAELFDSDSRTQPQASGLPTAAAGVVFHREHTRKEIFKRRSKNLMYLLREYLKIYLKSLKTFKGFFTTVYFLLVIAFGGMLFLLLLNAAPAMSRKYGPDDKVHSPRQIWIEIDSQILNALFCITGLGLFPLRCRDLYLWIRGRYKGDIHCNTKILKIHSNWFWAGFTSDWKLLLVIFLYIMNSVFQVLLCFVMWHYNRFTRPGWTTGVLIAASFSCVIVAGIIMFLEAKRIKVYCFQTGHERQPGLSFGVNSQQEAEVKIDDSATKSVSV